MRLGQSEDARGWLGSNKWLRLFDGPTTAMICFSRDDIWMDSLNEWPRPSSLKRGEIISTATSSGNG